MNIPNQIIPDIGNDMQFVRQHLIDPESCLCCGSCEAACSQGAIQTDRLMQRYVIDPAKCTECVGHFDAPQCVEVCPVDCIPLDPLHAETHEQLMQKFFSLGGKH